MSGQLSKDKQRDSPTPCTKCWKAMVTGNNGELDEAIRSKVRPYLYNNGDGKWIHCAHNPHGLSQEQRQA